VSEYRIELRPAAVRALRKLDPPIRRRVQGAIALLAQDPRPPAARALRGRPGLRIRVGDYRIIYTVSDDVLLVVTPGLRPLTSRPHGIRPTDQPSRPCQTARRGCRESLRSVQRRPVEFLDGAVMVMRCATDGQSLDVSTQPASR
jgi:mRNA interferase RelE/StbE